MTDAGYKVATGLKIENFTVAYFPLDHSSIVKRIVKKRSLARADMFVRKWGVLALLVQRIMPMFPENIVSISFGLTKMKYRTFIGIEFKSPS